MLSVSPRITSNPKPSTRTRTERFRFDSSPEDTKNDSPFDFGAVKAPESKTTFSNAVKEKSNSPLDSPRSVYIASSKPKIELKTLKTGFLDEEIVYEAMDRLNWKIRQQSMKDKAKESIKSNERKFEESPVVKKNKELVKIIQKYQSEKGMTPKTKEVKFDSHFKPFKSVKTFVNIQDVMKNLNEPVRTIINSKAQNVPNRTKPTLSTVDQAPKTPPRVSAERSLLDTGSPFGFPSESGRTTATRREGFSLESRLKRVNQERQSDSMENMLQHVKENVRNKIGSVAFETIKSGLTNPKKLREVQAKNQLEMKKMRETKQELRDMDLFHSLIDHLSVENRAEGIKVVHDEEAVDLFPFYTKLEKELDRENNNSEQVLLDYGPKKEELENQEHKQNLIQKLHFGSLSNKDSPNRERMIKKYNIDLSPRPGDEAEHEEQVKVATMLSAYRERSHKVIRLLKKKTTILHKGSSGSINSRSKLDIMDNLQSPQKFQTRDEYEEKKDLNLPSLIFGFTSEKTPTKAPSRSGLNLVISPYQDSYTPQPPLSGRSDERYSQSGIDNRKRYVQQRNLLKPSSNRYSVVNSRLDDSEGNLKPQPPSNLHRRTGHQIKERVKFQTTRNNHGSYEKSMEEIQGMLNNLSATNRKLETELNDTMRSAASFYNSKISNLVNTEIPDSLKVPPKIDYTKKKTSLIMKLTNKVMRDHIL